MPSKPATKPAATKPTPRAKAPAKPKRRRKPSLYALAGEKGRRAYQRDLLLASLEEHGWRFPAVAKALGIAGSSAVSRALDDVAPDEAKAARKDGRIKQGAPKA